ncbi:hypothetical protein [Pseudomonas sp. Irchel 3E13]|uniref:hypothetical protein n=1 Tax=Pseudomonas sp. Irchel 3E13 TaxID=2008975 RepID=UPI0015B1BD02|nr:hypothetical protein [Pseudomonas sp. Irchel 3E13]
MTQFHAWKTLACLLLMLQAGAGSTPANATEVTVSAEYRGGLDFVHTSRAPDFCTRWPGQCNAGPALDLPISYELATQDKEGGGAGYSIRVPGRRQVTVTNERSGESYSLEFEILALGLQVDTAAGAAASRPVQGGCAVAGAQNAGARSHYLWRINTPAQPATCFSARPDDAVDEAARLRIGELGLAYRLSTPSPLKMKPGKYRGRLVLSVGPGADFDLGHGVAGLTTDSLGISVELDVVHAFRLEFAQGSEQVVLEPPGGWGQWSNRLPHRLYRDVALRVWSSGPFSVHLRCQYNEAQRCGMRNRANEHQVPLHVALTLPGGFLHSGQAVSRLPLPVGEAMALKLESLQPMLNQGGVLHFDVGKTQVSEMARYPGMEYAGDVTVIFDAGM